MGSLTELLLKLRAIFRRRRLNQDLEDELAFHLEMKQSRSGLSPLEARRAFGNESRFREACRDLWTFRWLEALQRDARFGLRMLRRNPAFTLVAVLSLGIGIGANAAIFSLAHELLLKSLPVPAPEQLRLLTWVGGKDVPFDSISGYGDFDDKTQMQSSGSFSYPAFLALRDRLAPTAQVMAFRAVRVTAATPGETDLARAQVVSGNYFDALGLKPIAGRGIQQVDDNAGATPVVVISSQFWQRRFASDLRALGSPITMNGQVYSIVGILGPNISGMSPGDRMDLYYPASTQPQNGTHYPVADNSFWWAQIFVRLNPGTAEERFCVEADTIFRQMALADAKPGAKVDIPQLRVESGAQGIRFMRQNMSTRLGGLVAVAALVLLIACANLASLMLARGTARRREMAVRLSLGSGRWQLVRQLLTESLMLALAGGLLGLVIASPLAATIAKFGAADIVVNPGVNQPVLLFAFAVSLLAALVVGLLPALRLTRGDMTPALKDGGKQANSPKLAAGRLLVAGQVALSAILLVGAGLAVRTLINLSKVDVGFHAERLLVFQISPSRSGYTAGRSLDLYAQLRQRLASIPGVQDVALTRESLIAGSVTTTTVNVPGYVAMPDHPARAWVMGVSDGFLGMIGIKLLAGRDLMPGDGADAPPVAVVNQAFVRKYMSGGNPVGKVFTKSKKELQIVGMCQDAKYASVREPAPPTMYLSYPQSGVEIPSMAFALRTSVPPLSIANAVRRTVAAIDTQLPVAELRTQEEQIALSVGPERFFAAFIAAFGALATLLAAIGLYGVMAYSVARRTSEIGIRLALGARRPDVVWLVVRESIVVVCAGLAVGMPAAMLLARLIRSGLYGVEPVDPLSLAGGATLLLAVAALAALAPARRASRVDPMLALRCE